MRWKYSNLLNQTYLQERADIVHMERITGNAGFENEIGRAFT
jgi:hypothetical protein